PTPPTWRKKKRLRGRQRPLPALRPPCRLPRRPAPNPAEPLWQRPLRPRLLLLPPLRPRPVPLGRRRRPDRADAAARPVPRGCPPARGRRAALAGVVADSSERRAELLEEMGGIRLGESTVEGTAEDAGRRLAAAWQRGQTLGPKEDWCWHPDAKGRLVAYVSG